MKFKNIIVLLAVLILSSSLMAGEWDIDAAHSSIGFTVKHMVISKVRGSFNDYTASTVVFDPENPTSISARIEIDAASINTNNQKRDEHLKSKDFFNAEKFPKITFIANGIEKNAAGSYKVTGDLTMLGKTNPVILSGEGFTAQYKNPWGQTITAVSATGTINREDFGLSWNKTLESGGFLISKDVEIEINLELVKK